MRHEELELGETLYVGDVPVKLVKVGRNKVKVSVDAPKSVRVRLVKKTAKIDIPAAKEHTDRVGPT